LDEKNKYRYPHVIKSPFLWKVGYVGKVGKVGKVGRVGRVGKAGKVGKEGKKVGCESSGCQLYQILQ
jgi:hypothetical protein